MLVAYVSVDYSCGATVYVIGAVSVQIHWKHTSCTSAKSRTVSLKGTLTYLCCSRLDFLVFPVVRDEYRGNSIRLLSILQLVCKIKPTHYSRLRRSHVSLYAIKFDFSELYYFADTCEFWIGNLASIYCFTMQRKSIKYIYYERFKWTSQLIEILSKQICI